MASRSKLLPCAVLALALATAGLWASGAFVGGRATAPARALRAQQTMSRQALPGSDLVDALDASTVTNAFQPAIASSMQTSLPGFLACIVFTFVSVVFLLTLYV